MNRNAYRAGLTLVELLVAIVLTGILGMLLTQFFVSSTSAAAQADARNEALNDTTLAQQLIASKVRQAWYVAPPGTARTFAGLVGGNSWRVSPSPANQNVLMMVLPPNSSTSLTAAQNDQFQLYLYYAVPRATLRNAYAAAHPARPTDDPANANTLVIMQAIGTMGLTRPFDPAGGAAAFLAAPVTIVQVAPLMEYQQAAATPNIFTYRMVPGAATPAVQAVTIRLRSSRSLRGQNIQVPSQGNLSLEVYPRNPGR